MDDLQAMAFDNQLCSPWGTDTISCGASIVRAGDCCEQGILSGRDTGGMELRFGHAEALVQLTERIAQGEGFGHLRAEGSIRAAAIIGRGVEELAVAVKNHELPAPMPQGKRSLALTCAVNAPSRLTTSPKSPTPTAPSIPRSWQSLD